MVSINFDVFEFTSAQLLGYTNIMLFKPRCICSIRRSLFSENVLLPLHVSVCKISQKVTNPFHDFFLCWRDVRSPRTSRVDFDGDPDSFPYFAPIFTPVMHSLCSGIGIAILYYYSPGGGTNLGKDYFSWAVDSVL